MASVHLGKIFGLPSEIKKSAYWEIFGRKLIASGTAGKLSWGQVQSSHIIEGVPVQAGNMQFLARIPNMPGGRRTAAGADARRLGLQQWLLHCRKH